MRRVVEGAAAKRLGDFERGAAERGGARSPERRAGATMRGALLVLAIGLAGCGPPPIETCQLRCESECPPGWTCMGGYCVRPGSSACPAGGGDGGVDAPVADADVLDGNGADGAANDGIVTTPDAPIFTPDARRDGPPIITPDAPCVPMDGGLAPCF